MQQCFRRINSCDWFNCSIGGNCVKTIRYRLAPLLLLLASTGVVCAQSNVEPRVQKLEEAVRVLERRVADLEAQLRDRSTSAPVASASDKVNWRKLQKGLSEGDVERLLGSPLKVDAYGSFTVWHFVSGGEVQFDGRSRTVTGWHEP
jgi:hypothetical protein